MECFEVFVHGKSIILSVLAIFGTNLQKLMFFSIFSIMLNRSDIRARHSVSYIYTDP